MTRYVSFFVAVASFLFLSVPAAHAAIFQMGDGRFYDTGTGKTAPTRAELEISLGLPPTPTPEATSTIPAVEVTVRTPYLDAITAAQAELQQRIDIEKPSTPKTATSDTGWRRMTVAVWDKVTEQTTYHLAEKKGGDVRWLGEGIAARVENANGINSSFKFYDENKIVVAVRYPLYKDIGTKKKKKFQIEEVVYTPYSAALAVPEVVHAGEKHLNQVYDRVYEELDLKNVMSYAKPGTPITQVVDRSAAKAVLIIEHADSATVEARPEAVVERFYTTLGANKNSAYAFSQSHVGATGLVQFMPTSYTRFAKIRPELGLETGAFEAAMRNQQNALKAEVAYLDYQMSALPSSILASSTVDLHEFAVAAYNGGPSRVNRSMEEWEALVDGTLSKRVSALAAKQRALKQEAESLKKKILAEDDAAIWKPMQKKLNGMRAQITTLAAEEAGLKKGLLREETIGYVRKYRQIQAYFQSVPSSVAVTTQTP